MELVKELSDIYGVRIKKDGNFIKRGRHTVCIDPNDEYNSTFLACYYLAPEKITKEVKRSLIFHEFDYIESLKGKDSYTDQIDKTYHNMILPLTSSERRVCKDLIHLALAGDLSRDYLEKAVALLDD